MKGPTPATAISPERGAVVRGGERVVRVIGGFVIGLKGPTELTHPGEADSYEPGPGKERSFAGMIVDGNYGGRMLITRDRTSPMTDRAIIAWTAISPLTRWLRGMVSVGLNATTLVNAT